MHSPPKIDIVIPVYFAPELTIRCIQSIFKNTDFSYFDIKVILVEDSGSPENTALLEFFLNKLDLLNKIVLLKHETNKGFIEACYTGIEYRDSDYKILQNTDTYVMPFWLDEMVKTAETDDLIVMVNPNTNESAGVDVHMPPGFNINQMHTYFRNVKPDENDFIDLVTSTGFSLLIKSKYIKQFGFLDRVYGRGYCEETDLYFRFITQGLRGVLARNAYVYHRGEASFSDRDSRYAENSKILMKRYGSVYEGIYPNFLNKSILNQYRTDILKVKKLDLDVIVFSPSNTLDGGGKKIIHNFCNALNENGISATMACMYMQEVEHLEDRLYAPIAFSSLFEYEIRPKVLAFSLDYNATEVSQYADYLYSKYQYLPKIVHLTQDIEGWFDNNSIADFEICSDLAISKMIVSPFLDNTLKKTLNKNCHSQVILNSTSLDFATRRVPKSQDKIVISAMMRSDQKRGAQVIESALRQLSASLDKEIRFISFGNYKIKGSIPNIELVQHGVANENQIIKYLQQSDIFVEASYFQGFGLTSFEALYSGCKVISSGNNGALSVLPTTPTVSYFPIGNVEELTKLLLKEIKENNHNHPADHEIIYDYSSRKIFPLYYQYILDVIALPAYETVEFYKKAYKVLSIANPIIVTPGQMPQKYNRVRYKTVDRVMKLIDKQPWLYKSIKVLYNGTKKVVKKMRSK